MSQSTKLKKYSCLLLLNKPPEPRPGAEAQVWFETDQVWFEIDYKPPSADDELVDASPSHVVAAAYHLRLRITESSESLNPKEKSFLLFHGSACSISSYENNPLIRIDLSPFTSSEHCKNGKFYLSFKSEAESKAVLKDCCERLQEQARKIFPLYWIHIPVFDVENFEPVLNAAFLDECRKVDMCLIRFKGRKFKAWPSIFGKRTNAPKGKACRFIQRICYSLETVKHSKFFLHFIKHHDILIPEDFGFRHACYPFPKTDPTFDKCIGEGRLEKKFVPHGRGTMIYADGFVCEGFWKDNQRQGIGFLMTGEKLIIASFDRDGASSGLVDYLNGNWYEGYFNKIFQKHGKGTLHSVEMRDLDAGVRNAFCVGEWQNDRRTAANVVEMFEFIWSHSNLVHERWFESFMTQVSCVVNCRDLVNTEEWKNSPSNLPGTTSNPFPTFEQNIHADQNWMQLVTFITMYELLRPVLCMHIASSDDICKIIHESDAKIKSPDASLFVANAKLSHVQAQSIYIFTSNLMYENFLEELRSLVPERIRPWEPFLHTFQSAHDKLEAPPPMHSLDPDALPKLFTVVYRGLNLPLSHLYQKDSTVYLSFSSSSTNKGIAHEFADKAKTKTPPSTNGTVMKLFVKTAKCIKPLSKVPKEEELLIGHNTRFKVVTSLPHTETKIIAEWLPHNYDLIVLEEI